jgi:GntR family transcriptional regulator
MWDHFLMSKLKISIDFRSGSPIYIQIMDQVRHQIASEDLEPGDQLPTVRQLAADLRVNFNTIARAYRLLDDAGIISTQHGRGTFILEAPSKEATDRLRQEDLDRLAEHYMEGALELGFTPKEIRSAFEKKIESSSQENEGE